MINQTFEKLPYRITPLTADGAARGEPSVATGPVFIGLDPVTKPPTRRRSMVEGESLVSIGSYEFLRYEGDIWVEDEDEIDHAHFGFEIWPPIAGEPPFENHRGYVVLFHVEKRLHTSDGGQPYARYYTHPSRKEDHGGAHLMVQGPGWGEA